LKLFLLLTPSLCVTLKGFRKPQPDTHGSGPFFRDVDLTSRSQLTSDER
jgi:hypothetical protein